MNLRLQELQAEGRVDSDGYRTYMLLTLLTKLVLALVLGLLVVCGFLVT
ncbi:MAG TPA: hypothetical protein VET88_02070 [Gammaproteobacteria bacterium]|nr:hypothetical protein [Gammaproteobacteria bacterium]